MRAGRPVSIGLIQLFSELEDCVEKQAETPQGPVFRPCEEGDSCIFKSSALVCLNKDMIRTLSFFRSSTSRPFTTIGLNSPGAPCTPSLL